METRWFALLRAAVNPMYVGMGIFLIGEALLFPAITRDYLLLPPILWAIITAFVMAYEEPTLRRLFGADYEEYLRHVGRWVPQVRPYSPALPGQSRLAVLISTPEQQSDRPMPSGPEHRR